MDFESKLIDGGRLATFLARVLPAISKQKFTVILFVLATRMLFFRYHIFDATPSSWQTIDSFNRGFTERENVSGSGQTRLTSGPAITKNHGRSKASFINCPNGQ